MKDAFAVARYTFFAALDVILLTLSHGDHSPEALFFRTIADISLVSIIALLPLYCIKWIGEDAGLIAKDE